MSAGVECSHTYVEAEVVRVPAGYESEIGVVLTICASCGLIAGAER